MRHVNPTSTSCVSFRHLNSMAKFVKGKGDEDRYSYCKALEAFKAIWQLPCLRCEAGEIGIWQNG